MQKTRQRATPPTRPSAIALRCVAFAGVLISLLASCVALPAEQPANKLAAGTPTAAAGQPAPSAEIVGDDPELLREWVRRSVLAPPAYGGMPPGSAQLILGRLPDGLPVALPLPAGARVIGSVVRADQPMGGVLVDVVLDAPQPAAAARAFYQEALAAQGFTVLESPGGGGFVPDNPYLQLCREQPGAMVTLIATDLAGGADVRLSVQTGAAASPCQAGSGAVTVPQARMPELRHPEGTRMLGGGAGSSGPGSTGYVSADIESPLSVAELAAHYAVQLEAAGWERLGTQAAEGLATSDWRMTDEEGRNWLGRLFVLGSPAGTSRRSTLFQLEPQP